MSEAEYWTEERVSEMHAYKDSLLTCQHCNATADVGERRRGAPFREIYYQCGSFIDVLDDNLEYQSPVCQLRAEIEAFKEARDALGRSIADSILKAIHAIRRMFTKRRE